MRLPTASTVIAGLTTTVETSRSVLDVTLAALGELAELAEARSQGKRYERTNPGEGQYLAGYADGLARRTAAFGQATADGTLPTPPRARLALVSDSGGEA